MTAFSGGRKWTRDEIIAWRQRLGLSQADFASRLGVRQQTVSEWETGKYAPRGASLTVLRMVAEEPADYDQPPPSEEHRDAAR